MVLAHAGLTACPPFSVVTPYSTALLKQLDAAEHAAASSHTVGQPHLQAAFLNLHLFFCLHRGLRKPDKPDKWSQDSEQFAGSGVATSVISLLEMQPVSKHPKPAGYSDGQWVILLAHTLLPGRSKAASSQQAHCTSLVRKSTYEEDHRAWCEGLKKLLSR